VYATQQSRDDNCNTSLQSLPYCPPNTTLPYTHKQHTHVQLKKLKLNLNILENKASLRGEGCIDPRKTATLGGCQNNIVHCNTLQNTATHLQHTCNTLHHITTNLLQKPSSTEKTRKCPFTPNLRTHTSKHALIHMETFAV